MKNSSFISDDDAEQLNFTAESLLHWCSWLSLSVELYGGKIQFVIGMKMMHKNLNQLRKDFKLILP